MGIEKVETRGREPKEKRLKRFWVGWSSRRDIVDTPFPKWKLSVTRVPFVKDALSYGYAAVVDAEDRESAWQMVVVRFVDADEAFVKEKPRDFWPPADRFPRPS